MEQKHKYSKFVFIFANVLFSKVAQLTTEMKGITRCKLTIISESAICKKFH
jgi:hypothetical protein